MRNSTITVEVVKTLDDLAGHADEWNQLALKAPYRLPMHSYTWVASHFEHCLGDNESWFCVFGYDGDELVGVLPLVVTHRRFIGFERPVLHTLSGNQTISGDAVVADGREGEVVAVLLQAAGREYPARLYLEFRRVTVRSPVLALSKGGLKGAAITKTFDGVGAYLKTQGKFKDYRASLSSNFRSNMNKEANKLKKLSGVETVFLDGEDATSEDLPRFMGVEASGWKGRTGTAILNSPTLISFYTTLTRRLSECGWLEWEFLVADGKTLTGNLAIRFNRSIFIWKLGYDENYAKCSPGRVLFEQLVKRACDTADIDEIDLLTDMPWYDNWKMDKR